MRQFGARLPSWFLRRVADLCHAEHGADGLETRPLADRLPGWTTSSSLDSVHSGSASVDGVRSVPSTPGFGPREAAARRREACDGHRNGGQKPVEGPLLSGPSASSLYLPGRLRASATAWWDPLRNDATRLGLAAHCRRVAARMVHWTNFAMIPAAKTTDLPDTIHPEATRLEKGRASRSCSMTPTVCRRKRTDVTRSTQTGPHDGRAPALRRGPRIAGRAGVLAALATVCLHSSAAKAEELVDSHRNYLTAGASTIGPSSVEILAEDGAGDERSSWLAPGLSLSYRHRSNSYLTLGAGVAGHVLAEDTATSAYYPWHARLEVSAGVLVPLGEACQLEASLSPGLALVASESYFRGVGPSVAVRSGLTCWVERHIGLTASGVLLAASVNNWRREGDSVFNDSSALLFGSMFDVGVTWRD